jgi:hypothetical protein
MRARTWARSLTGPRTSSARSAARLSGREHEGEAVGGLVRVEMAPAHQVGIEARPGRLLVGVVGQDAGGAALLDGLLVHDRRIAVGQDQPPTHLLALVVGGGRAGAHIDELRGDVGVLAVVGERHGQRRELGEHPGRGRDLLETRLARLPAEVAREVRVRRLPVGGERQDLDLGETRRAQLAGQPLGGGAVAGRALHAVVPAEDADRLEHGGAVDARLDLRQDLVGPERDAAGQRARRRGQEQRQDRRAHDHRSPRCAAADHGSI